jgi:periplasmic divalent cation tolerance protein
MHIVVFITVGGRCEADRIGGTLVEEGLAACVNTVGPITSVYRWKGRVERAEEHLLIAKTVGNRLEELMERVKSLHSYSVPEIIALRIEGGSTEYLRWLEDGSAGLKRGQE